MPTAALAHLAKARHIPIERAEELWHKAKGIVSKEYGGQKKNKGYWPLVMGITKKMMGIHEVLTVEEELLAEQFGADEMNNLLRNLMMARNCAHVHHWQSKSLSMHLALGELYEQLTEFMDELAEMYMGMSGETVHPVQSDPNHFSEQDPHEFVQQLSSVLIELKSSIAQDPPLINKFEEMQGVVERIKYKMENLK